MRPSQKGWINQYLQLIIGQNKTKVLSRAIHDRAEHIDQDQKLYKLVQPTGLMYGHPVSIAPQYNLKTSHWDDAEKMKFIFLDSLVNGSLIINSEELKSDEDFSNCISETIYAISKFYQENIPAKDSRNVLRKKRASKTDDVENILNHRVEVRSKWSKSYWASFFENSLLFLDVYYFGCWLKRKNNNEEVQEFDEQQETLRLKILQIIAAAAHSNKIIEQEEKALFKFFLQSARLTNENEEKAKDYLKTEVLLEDIDLNFLDSWIIRKYILELAILTVWADRQLDEVEKKFIGKLSRKLGFKHQELQSSLLAIESFVITNWQQVHFLQKKHNLLIIKDRFSKRLSNTLHKNKKALVQEVNESKELLSLLHKMSREHLSDEEKRKVKSQLLDILKTLPTFVIVALPGTFITLPLLLNILPKSAFPSAFSEVD